MIEKSCANADSYPPVEVLARDREELEAKGWPLSLEEEW